MDRKDRERIRDILTEELSEQEYFLMNEMANDRRGGPTSLRTFGHSTLHGLLTDALGLEE